VVSPLRCVSGGAGPRGALADDEQNNIEVFKTASPSVVHITTLAYARNFLSPDVMQIPQG